ncbi:platelet factor 4 [Saccopteryx bilineata]|uniref:platelet factor 4 n=1 Tax=Saccopteryx bilineata TaxID=59482 RepID=UPI00338DAEB3
MSLGASSRASRPRPGPGLLLLGLLLLPAVVAGVSADPEEGDRDLQCVCAKTTSRIHPKRIINLEVIGAGPHCPTSQMIATLRKGEKICLDPHAPIYKNIIKKLIKSTESKLLANEIRTFII